MSVATQAPTGLFVLSILERYCSALAAETCQRPLQSQIKALMDEICTAVVRAVEGVPLDDGAAAEAAVAQVLLDALSPVECLIGPASDSLFRQVVEEHLRERVQPGSAPR